jgi:hypothetical protein
MLEEGRFGSVRELAEAERVSLSYISRILRLTLLAPDVVEWILDGRSTAGLAESSSRSRSSGRCSGSELVRAGCGNARPEWEPRAR